MSYRIGLDIGIASCGWSVLKTNQDGIPFKIINLDSVVFPKGETPKTGQSLAAQRRSYRAGRRLNRRRKFRKYRVKRLFINNHLLTKRQISGVFKQKPMPSVYSLRVKGLERRLTNLELFQVLYFLAGHRGFHSNRKYALTSKNVGPLLESIRNSRDLVQKNGYKTIGEMIAKDSKFNHQKRNHNYNNGYLVTASRSMINDEAKLILGAQKRFNQQVSDHFIKKYVSILDSQRNYDQGPSEPSPYAGNQIEKMIGRDTLDHTQERAAKATYTFEYYRLLTQLNNFQYKLPFKHWNRLDRSQKQLIINLCFKYKQVKFKQIKKALNLDKSAKFNLIRYGNYKSQKQAESKTVFISLKAIHEIQNYLPEDLRHSKNLIDNIGEILTKFASDETRREAFSNRLNLPSSVVSKLLSLNYSKFGHLSLKTMRKLIPYLEDGDTLNGAIHEAGYSHENKIDAKYVHENVKNPVVMRAFTITRKVVRAIIHRYGKPDAINIELARDLNKSHKERQQIQRIQAKFRRKNEQAAERLRSNGFPVNGQNITIDNLYHEQQGIDPYTGKQMNINQVFNGNGNYYNIDHIIPYSWTFNDSYTNKVLVSTKANEDKANRLPMQYLMNDQKRKNFLIYFASNYIKNYKKRTNLLRKFINYKQLDQWKSRNINDTRWMAVLIADYLEQNVQFNDDTNLGKEKVIRSNGSMTAKMRHRWGLVKVRANGDKHHALDATTIASITPALIKRVNDFNKYQEIKDNPVLWRQNDFSKLKNKVLTSKLFNKFFNAFPLPWHDFREELNGRLSDDPSKYMSGRGWDHYDAAEIKHLKPVHVVHRVSHKINGQVNKDTKRSAKYLSNGKIMVRVAVNTLKLNKRGQIKSGYYTYFDHKDHGNQLVKKNLVSQLKANDNKGSKAFPDGYLEFRNGSQTQVVRKVEMINKAHGGVISHDRRSISDSGKIVRIDVFRNVQNHKYCYVPIYLKDVLKPELPDIIANAGKKTKHLSNRDEFQFSLYHYTPVHIIFKKPRKIKWLAEQGRRSNTVTDFYGYYVNPNVRSGAINLVSFDRSFKAFDTGISSLKLFEKYNINYLGEIHKVHQKKRRSFKGIGK